MKNQIKLGLLLMCSTGIALGCALKSLPPFKVDVSLWDIAVAWFQGASNPSSAAFLSNLDEQGQETFGAQAWHSDNYVGYVYPKVAVGGMSGASQIFINKPCNSKAIDSATRDSGGGGGGGGGPGTGDPPPGDGWFDDCLPSTVRGCTSVEGGSPQCESIPVLECY